MLLLCFFFVLGDFLLPTESYQIEFKTIQQLRACDFERVSNPPRVKINTHPLTRTRKPWNNRSIYLSDEYTRLESKIESKLDGRTRTVLNVIESVIVWEMQWQTSNNQKMKIKKKKEKNNYGIHSFRSPKRQYTLCKWIELQRILNSRLNGIKENLNVNYTLCEYVEYLLLYGEEYSLTLFHTRQQETIHSRWCVCLNF